MVSMKAFIENGGSSYLTDKYKDIILREPTTLSEMMAGWNDENNLPSEYEELLKRSMDFE